MNRFKNIKIGDKMLIETHNAIYENSILSISIFEKLVKRIERILKKLKGFHKYVLPLKIKFISNKEMKEIGKYKYDTDEIWLNYFCKLCSKHSRYYCISYALLHEMGHKYISCNKISFDYNDNKWITTPYSRISNSKTEKFAELFALSHFKYKGTPFNCYRKTVNEFIKYMYQYLET